MFQLVNRPSRDSQRNHVSAGNPSFPQLPKEPRSEQVMSHPQVGRSWLVHSSEEELSHHLQPPPANQLAKASPTSEEAVHHLPAGRAIQEAGGCHSPEGLLDHPDPSTYCFAPGQAIRYRSTFRPDWVGND
jgi:hypothetical protein